MDDFPAELLACSDEGGNPSDANELRTSVNGRSHTFGSETECSRSTNDASSDYNNDFEPSENYQRPVESSIDKQCLKESTEAVPDSLSPDHRTSEIGSTSSVEQKTPHFVPIGDMSDVVEIDPIKEKRFKMVEEEVSSSNSSNQNVEHLCESRRSPLHNRTSDLPIISSSTESSASPQLEPETSQQAASVSPGFFMLDRGRERNNGVLHVDVVSISSSSLFTSRGEVSNHEARRNSRRLFWDAFSRRSSRRHSDSRTLVFSSEDSEDLGGSRDRWLLDFSGDLFEDGLGGGGGDSGILGSGRNRGPHEARWHSRSEIWERFRGSLDETSQRTAFCASGLHPDGTCSCESFLAEESSTRGSISRIVMLAEALFEVLDEIHRQPISLSLSMVSHPAPETVVDSFPIKNHEKPNGADQEVEQCYICLAEYEEADKIRVLPCRHEFHMACVDKWLKEIHGVCPLCRGDVCAGLAEESIIPHF
ncbi:RING-type E3 ubiquitin transferase [Ranunculus cassubicifolius]